jgi:hypothetical protein
MPVPVFCLGKMRMLSRDGIAFVFRTFNVTYKTEPTLAYGSTCKLAALTLISNDEDFNNTTDMPGRAGKRRGVETEYIESSINNTILRNTKEA